MILIHIATKEESQAEEISDFLLKEQLVFDAFISRGIKRRLGENGTIKKEVQYQVTGKARALKFDQIDSVIRKKYKSNVPELYSVPIVNMDWWQPPPDDD